ncbi:MAG: rRNA maturation RNase YbeY [Ardenticatenaceae bacterium]|nr:rRNA maturation RNase YbeY [Ardenticatenaceae bacterium]
MSSSEFQIEIQDDVPVPEGAVALLATAVSHTLTHQQIAPPAQLTLLLTDDKTIQQLNRNYRQVNAPTDVLSFPDGDILPGTNTPYLGDIAISVPYAAHQAAQTGHDLAAELQLLAIHGTLHLLGHDHGEPEEKATMWAAQQTILDQLGLSHVTPTEA